MWKEAVVASFEIISKHVPKGLRKIVTNLSENSVFWQNLNYRPAE
jgi:hypothetical protein